MELTVTGIVIKRTVYRENSLILTLFTGEQGIIDVTAYGASSMKNGVCSGSQLCVYGEYVLSYKRGRYTVKNCHVIEPFSGVNNIYERFAEGCRVLILAKQLYHDNADSCKSGIYLLYSCLGCMAYTDMDIKDIYIFFLLRSLEILGECPAVTNCAVCGDELLNMHEISFSVPDGGAACPSCAKAGIAKTISPVSLEAMRRMLLLNYEDMYKIVLPQQVRAELIRFLEEYCSYYFLSC